MGSISSYKGHGREQGYVAPSVDLDPEILAVMGTPECDPRALFTACFDGLLGMVRTMRPDQVGLNAWSVKIAFPKGTARKSLEQLYTEFAQTLQGQGQEHFQGEHDCNYEAVRDTLIADGVFDPLTTKKYLLRHDPNRPAMGSRRAPLSAGQLI